MHRKSAICLVLAVVVLIVIGCVMLFSTSTFAQEHRSDPNYFIKRQFMWLAVGFVACLIAVNMDYHLWGRVAWVLYGTSAILLVLCFVPHVGQRINGSNRWLNLRIASFQPSELAKLAVVCALAWWFSREEKDSGSFVKGFIAPLGIAGGLMALIAPEVDMGTTALIGGSTLILMFIAGTRLRYLAPTVLLGVGALALAIQKMPERTGRFLAFLYPEKYPADAYQTMQGLIALGSGGVEGLGLGNGRQKMAYLPFAHTDFIFPVLGEELGLRCTLFVVFLYLVIILCGATIALRARDRFGLLLGFGIVMLIALQAAVNIGVTTALLPNKGLPLPFISYGGSNLAFCMLCLGILINIYRQGINEKERDRASTKLTVNARKRLLKI